MKMDVGWVFASRQGNVRKRPGDGGAALVAANDNFFVLELLPLRVKKEPYGSQHPVLARVGIRNRPTQLPKDGL